MTYSIGVGCNFKSDIICLYFTAAPRTMLGFIHDIFPYVFMEPNIDSDLCNKCGQYYKRDNFCKQVFIAAPLPIFIPIITM